MTTTPRPAAFAFLALFAATSLSHATVLVDEPFNYPLGSITGLNGGIGFAGPFTGTGTVSAPGQTFTDLATSGNTFSTAGSDAGAFRLLLAPINTDSGVLFVRFLGSNTTGAAPQYAGFSFFNGGSEELFLGKTFQAVNYGLEVSGPGGGVATSNSPISATTTLLVYRLTFGTNNDTIDLFVNPGATLPGTPSATFTTANNGVFPATFDGIRLQSGNGTQTFDYDEIRIATTAAEVLPIPEPATMVTLVGGLAVLGFVRRRKSNRN